MSFSPICVLIVGHYLVFRADRGLFDSQADGIQVVAVAETARESMTLAAECRPDVILLDAQMPETDVAGWIARLHRQHPETRILAFFAAWNELLALALLRAGAVGCLSQEAGDREIVAAVRAAYRQEVTVDPQLMADVVQELRQHLSTLP